MKILIERINMAQQIFRRTEIKYLLTEKQVRDLMWLVEPYLKKDKYFKGTNCSIYFDNDSRYLAIHSMEKPLYKEKIRIRSYGVPRLNDTVFLEIKKKVNGVGGKRRIPVKLSDFYNYLETGELDSNSEVIKKELDMCMERYGLKPTMFLAYDRTSYCGKDDPTFRLTFDRNVRSRNDELRLELGDHGEKFFENNLVVMEVKAMDAYPFFFVRALSKLKIYPASFSKYGRVTEKVIYHHNLKEK
ncbi:polyphosphate polymerase domain-containing protein [Candidatus Saccharibacteria bacterium]|nr:polyphosphate polymerase domain-containing protein [Candidatus Saccharibacteria bacterium]